MRALALLAALTFASATLAQYPARQVTIVVPFTTGGSNDLFARTIGTELGNRWKQAIVIENRAGAGGSVGAQHVAKSAPDGHTFMLMSSAITVNHLLQPKVAPDPITSFSPIGLVGKGPLMMIAAPGLGLRTVEEVIAFARAKPGVLRFASAGSGSSTHLAMEMLAAATGTQLTHVPYKGGTQAVTDVIGGHVDMYIGSIPQVAPHVRTGKVVGVAVTGPERSPAAPDVPTVAERVPGFAVELWWGLFAPAGTPGAIVESINRTVNEILVTPKMREFLAAEAAVPIAMTPARFTQYVAEELERWRKVIVTAKITVN